MMTDARTNFLGEIKKATSEQHLAMESDPLLAQLLSTQLTQEQYVCYLRLFLEVTKAYEAVILPTSFTTLPGWVVSYPSEKILQDLEFFGLKSLPELSHPYEIPAENGNTAFCLGFTYVMEGSKLGGKVLARSVIKTLGLQAPAGINYLSDHGQDSFPLWKQFLQQFSEYIIFYNLQQQAIEGANQAFASIAAFFRSNSGLYEL